MITAREQLFNTPIDDLVGRRLGRIMKLHGYKNVKKLLSLKSVTLQRWHGIGSKTIEEFLEAKKSIIVPK